MRFILLGSPRAVLSKRSFCDDGNVPVLVVHHQSLEPHVSTSTCSVARAAEDLSLDFT